MRVIRTLAEFTSTSRRGRHIQSAIVFMFFISIFANIVIIFHSHTKEKSFDYDFEHNSNNVRSVDISGLGSILVGNITGSKQNFARSLAACIKERIRNKSGTGKSSPLDSSENIHSLIMEDDILSSLNWTFRQEFQRQQKVFKLLSRPIINRHDYSYIHNPKDTCVKRKIDVVFAVSSVPENFENRMKTRQGLKGSYSFVTNNNATLLFFIGRSNHHNKSRRFQVGVNMEMRRFGDIVQEDFLDEYKNISLKSISVLKWVSVYCPQARYVIKSDDNVGIKPAYALESLTRHRQRFGNFILGKWNSMTSVQRKTDAKNYVSFKEYPHATFPPHFLGGAMGFPVSTAKLLYETTLRVQPIWLADVFITGICAPLVNVPTIMDMAFDFKINSW
uniref:Hexosyltransferase n=1 Tax=Arion vulgaris TaxID=1028688 RepID=A0A0B6ZHE6_9EUPU